MSNNYNVLAKHITSKYIDRICGNDIDDRIIGEDPAKRVMVGMLAENRVEQTFSGDYAENTSTKFESVPSISVSFVVKKHPDAVLRVIPTGLVFYSVMPDYVESRDYVLARFIEKDRYPYRDIEELSETHPGEKYPFPITYKKASIADYMGDGIEIIPSNLQETRFHLESQITQMLSSLATQVMPEVKIVQSSHIPLADLVSEERFHSITTIKNEAVSPRWTIDINCSVTDQGNSWRFLLQMVNKTPVTDKQNVGYIPKIFNAGLRIVGNSDVVFEPIELDCFRTSFKARPAVFAVSENTSAQYDSASNAIITDNIPVYYQHRLLTKDEFNPYIRFDKLLDDPISNLRVIKHAMDKDYNERKAELHGAVLSDIARDKFKEALKHYKYEIDRFEHGIRQIEYKDTVRKAFHYMNATFKTKFAKESRAIVGWRLFQIVFIVSMIPELIRSEYKNDPDLSIADLEVANLLYFPTGGGKTEAFLGVTVFSMFFDRLRGKNDGITAIIKYPLRLLAVQQLDRVLAVIMKANTIRESAPELKNKNPFHVGFYVGKENTPNRIDPTEKLSERDSKGGDRGLILECDQDTMNEYYRFIDTCPCCGEKMVNVRFNREQWKLEHICDNPNCSTTVLPLMIVDSEIYRYLPSVVVSTIDKMAMLGTTNEFKMLLGRVKRRCPVHGFSATSRCIVKNCECRAMEDVPLLKDPAPTLFIQDEMHLVKESLGTFDAHYESFISYYAKELMPVPQQKQIRFIGATATITRYEDHIKHLYHMEPRRFPCEYPSMKQGEDFYSYTNMQDISRIILGYAPYGRSVTDSVWESGYIMRLVVYDLIRNLDRSYSELCAEGFSASKAEYENMLYDYWIELVYNNRKQDAMDLENAFQNQGNNYLEEKGVPKFEIKQMTSDVDFQAVRKALFDIQANRKNFESTNLLLATSTISHGVDEDSFNVMYFFGIPNNNAEYIQAYSRTGRKYTGIVIDIIRLMRLRDRSYLKNFVIFHQNKDDLVESVPINRWAKNAIYSTLPGLLSGLIMQYYTIETGIDQLYSAVEVKKLLQTGKIQKDDVIEKLIGIYGCNPQEKLSQTYMEIIRKEVEQILSDIENGSFNSNTFLSNAIGKFSKGKKMPMRSLRDTEEQIEIQITGG